MAGDRLRLIAFDNASNFLELAEPSFRHDEAVSGLVYGICLRMKAHPETVKATPFFAAVCEGARVVHVAMLTPPYNVVVWSARPDRANPEALEQIAAKLIEDGRHVPGVLGPVEASDAFAQIWSRRVQGATVRRGMRERVYELRRVIPPRAVSGRLRLADESDLPVARDWFQKFLVETGVNDPVETALENLRARIQDRGLYFWEDGGTSVSMAGMGRATPRGAAIGPVYTPPELRGNGYASNCVAALSQHILDTGKDFVTLFTDLDYAASNSVYMKIGYVPRCDLNEWRFG